MRAYQAKWAGAQSIDLSEGSKDKLHGLLGINVEGPTRIGYYFSPVCSTQGKSRRTKGPVFLPTGERHKFAFDYDPNGNKRNGQINVTVDDEPFTLDLKPGQRSTGETFDHFGLLSVRTGGKYVTIHLDDLAYTARRPPEFSAGISSARANHRGLSRGWT